jgi:hypothetical protein
MSDWKDLSSEAAQAPESEIVVAETEHEPGLKPSAEIGPEDSSEPLSEQEIDENAVAETGCQIRVGKGVCGRPFHGAPDGADSRGNALE